MRLPSRGRRRCVSGFDSASRFSTSSGTLERHRKCLAKTKRNCFQHGLLARRRPRRLRRSWRGLHEHEGRGADRHLTGSARRASSRPVSGAPTSPTGRATRSAASGRSRSALPRVKAYLVSKACRKSNHISSRSRRRRSRTGRQRAGDGRGQRLRPRPGARSSAPTDVDKIASISREVTD